MQFFYKSRNIPELEFLYRGMLKLFFVACACIALSGCQTFESPSVADQAALGHSVFDFSGKGPAAYGNTLTGQIETGRLGASNISGGGCAACQ